MRLSSGSVSSSKRVKNHRSNSRTRTKHKKLDAICEKTYNRNRGVAGESNEGNGGAGSAGVDSELRRSSRVRRAPVLLDSSPPPSKKRRRIDWNGESFSKRREKGKAVVRSCSSPGEDSGELKEGEVWKSRLRSRAKTKRVRFVEKDKEASASGKRKLFRDMDGCREEETMVERELDEKKEELDGGKSTVVRSKRPGRIKASNVLGNSEEEIDLQSNKGVEDERVEVEMLVDKGERDFLVLNSEMDGGNEVEAVDGGNEVEAGVGAVGNEVEAVDGENEVEAIGNEVEAVDGGNEVEAVDGETADLLEKEKSENQNGLSGNDNVETIEQNDKQMEHPECVNEGENERDVLEVGVAASQVEDVVDHDGQDACLDNPDEKPVEPKNSMGVDKSNKALAYTLGKPRIKEGRRCGLCGGGTDGKPPKRVVQDIGESENEACSGSSASDEPNYDPWDGFGDEPSWLGRLLGPINDRYGIAGIWIHQHCAVWSPEVYFAGLGCLKNVRAALCRGRALKCSRCGRPGATIGCRVDRCPKTYHLPCARANGCIFDHRKFLIACTDHRHLFQPHGNQYLQQIKKMKAKKMKLEIRKVSNDACRKDLEAEEKWLEHCGEDEEFLKRESKRLHRDILRIAPVYIGGPGSEGEKLFQGWESVAGLQDVIRCLKEVVILPLLYPEFFNNLGLTPPRGVLLHGYPGTGKTLVVRALIGSCARGDKRIAYFARKGADCLGKYVGDAERQLRLLFQVAERSQPSIIFFDEIDGLAPCRTRQQDQTHSSVVSTLLALLDGLKSRGSVVVIGATNRPEAVDPALRRPGRFDREIYFPLPSVKDRISILSLHTQRWPKPVTGPLLNWIARKTAGFAGADLQALCTQAAIIALKRNCPFQELVSHAGEKAPDRNRYPLPSFAVEERDWLEALSCAPPPCSRREAGMSANEVVSSPLPTHLISCLLRPLSSLLVSLYLDECLYLPPLLYKAAKMIKNVIVGALRKKKMPNDHWWAQVNDLLQKADVIKEIERNLSCLGILIGEAGFPFSDALNDDTDEDRVRFDPSRAYHNGIHTTLLRNISYTSGKKSGFRILIAGSPRSGQRHLASCILHCFVGNVEIQKVDLATISQEGRGDVLEGLTRILMKCTSVGSCMLFLPRIDLWAIETSDQDDEECSSSTDHQSSEEEFCITNSQVVEKENVSGPRACKSTETGVPEDVLQRASHAWRSFIEQVDSMCVSTSLIILATSDLPYAALPKRIREFFKTDILNYSCSASSEHTVPQFSVQVDGNFNRDTLIDSSATELSRDLVQQFVQLIHHRTHILTSVFEEYKACDTSQGNKDMVYHGADHVLANEGEDRAQCPEESVAKVPSPPNSRTVKGKSNLLLAISTFGYQMLRYPHFAELCWVTSKLKDGPCADINGPWKGWPFNSCIIRPSNSLEKVAVACSPSNTKSKEKFGLVRGLVAVGLSAYRGAYVSLREVSLEVRKVLELLVDQINAKIQSGKDRYEFGRILSQVACLEDMVNSWVYTLQSLEVDGQMTVVNPKPGTVGSSSYACGDDVDNLIESKECGPNVSNRSSHEGEVPEERPEGFTSENTGFVNLHKGDVNSGDPNLKEGVPISEKSPLQTAFLTDSAPVEQFQSSLAANFLDGKVPNMHDGTSKSFKSENSVKCMVNKGDSGLWRQSNGFAFVEPVVHSEDSLCSAGELSGLKSSSCGKFCNQFNGLSMAETDIPPPDGKSIPDEPIVNVNVSSIKTTNIAADSGVICLYRCCAECLYTLHSLMQKILIREWEVNGTYWTVEDVHDVVASLSVDLLSAVRKNYAAESFGNLFDKKMRQENHGKLSECQEMSICQCKNSGNRLVMPIECSCHSLNKSLSAKANPSRQLDLKFIYRDGVLVPIDLDKDVSFHCKFETLCLCSLIEWIVMTKQPFD